MNRRIYKIEWEVKYGDETTYRTEMATTSGVIGVVEKYAEKEAANYWPNDTEWDPEGKWHMRGDWCAGIRVSRVEEVVTLHLHDLDSNGLTTVHLLPCTVLA